MEILTSLSKSELEQIFTDSLQRVLNHNKIFNSPQPELVQDEADINGASKITGLKISSLYKGSWNGSIPCSKRGKRLIFSRKELEQWKKDRTVPKVSRDHIAAEELATSVRERKTRKSA